jgi:small-conductance mechanosensitive channel
LESLRAWLGSLESPSFMLGDSELTLWSLLYMGLLFIVLIVATSKVASWFATKIMARSSLEASLRDGLVTVLRFTLLTTGFIIILQTAGVNLNSLTIIFGALGIGVGFGLQGITSNLVSGLIILVERPIKVGDRIEVGDVTGDVIRISARATTVVTNNNIAIIIPNNEFVTSRVVNWSYTNRDVRFEYPVPVAYDCDPEIVRTVLLKVAAAHPGVLTERRPDVMLDSFGEDSFNFNLRVWTRDYATRPGVLRSELNYAIALAFKEHGLRIPFPQRDLHFPEGEIAVRMLADKAKVELK